MFETRRQTLAQKNLSAGEKLIGVWGINKAYAFFWAVLGVGIFLLGLSGDAIGMSIGLFVALVLFLYSLYLQAAYVYIVTDRRVISYFQFLNTHLVEIEFDKLTDIMVKEGFIEKLLFGSGAVLFNSAGTSIQEIAFSHISDPHEVRKKVNEIKSNK